MTVKEQGLGDYVFLRELGHGTFSTSFLVEHRFMKRPFVLKVLPEELVQDEAFIERLQQEVGILSTIEHPNIVRLHTVSFDQGKYFLITDAILDEKGDTTTLSQFIASKSKRFTEEELFALLYQVAQALDALHSYEYQGKSLIHGGLKLSNILIGKGKDRPRIALSDCCLSSLMGCRELLNKTFAAAAEECGLAERGGLHEKLHPSFLQSFAFLAPEQKHLSQFDNLTVQCDTYAFGVLVYYLMMGRSPEGYFPMPSASNEKHRFDWDGLIALCLQTFPKDRPIALAPILQTLSSGEKLLNTSRLLARSSSPNHFEDDMDVIPDIEGEGPKPVIRATHIDRPVKDFDITENLKVDPTVKVYHPEEDEVTDLKPIRTEMVIIQGGNFYRGSTEGNRDASPRHEIRLNSFAIDAHPVTNEQFIRFLKVMNGEKDRYHRDLIRLKESRIKRLGGKFVVESGYQKHPVVGVTWYGAVAYAKWVGKRLPSEAEWEVTAAGAGGENRYPTGEDIDKTKANFFSTDTTPVMSYPPNDLGIYDMAGNVYEWCFDWYDYNYYTTSAQEPDNPKGPFQGVYRVLRGGCWKSSKDDLLCTCRHRNNPGTVNGTYGFRCAADVQ